MSEAYLQRRRFFEDISGTVTIDPLATDTVLKAGKALDTIYLQVVKISLVTAGQMGSIWRISDTNGAVVLSDIPVEAVGEIAPYDLGATGRALGEGEGLILTAEPPGAVGLVTWDGYRKRTGVGAA